jgi:hypothetical protein
MQFKVQRRMADPERMSIAAQCQARAHSEPAQGRALGTGFSPEIVRKYPPARELAVESAQLFGLAASIAAWLTIWPISLACSASERIWA